MNRRQLLRLGAMAAVAPKVLTPVEPVLEAYYGPPTVTWVPSKLEVLQEWLERGIITPAAAAAYLDLPD